VLKVEDFLDTVAREDVMAAADLLIERKRPKARKAESGRFASEAPRRI
jgi:hypothetical protein